MSEPWTVPFQWGPEPVPPRRLAGTTTLLFGIALLYLFGMVHAARLHVGVEIAIALGFPLLFAASGFFKDTDARILQLLWFESGYNALVILNKLALLYALPAAASAVGYAFAVFFLVQTLGFVRFELDERRPLGIVQSLTLAGLIGLWFFTSADPAGRIDADGRFLMWGEDAPLALQLAYVIWVTNALIGDLNDVNFRLIVLHGASVTVALASGEFFHARLLTAAHLFCLDLAFQYNRMPPRQLPEDIGFLPVPWRRWFIEKGRDPLAAVTLLGMLILIGVVATRGMTLGL